MNSLDHKFCVAPMMDWTDRHCRFFHRLLVAARALLYTEMVTAEAVLHGDRERLLGFSPARASGGAAARRLRARGELAEAAAIGEDYGYDEINLNVGCPSDRVQEGRFGACLMAEPELVADCVAAMRRRVAQGAGDGQVPDRHRRPGRRTRPCSASLTWWPSRLRTFIVHARKAWLQGLSPKENREVPPLDYDRVSRLKAAHRPSSRSCINGGITTLEEAEAHLGKVDGVALGRAAYQNPYLLAEVDRALFGSAEPLPIAARGAGGDSCPTSKRHLGAGGRLNNIVRHILGLYHGQPCARAFRRHLSRASAARRCRHRGAARGDGASPRASSGRRWRPSSILIRLADALGAPSAHRQVDRRTASSALDFAEPPLRERHAACRLAALRPCCCWLSADGRRPSPGVAAAAGRARDPAREPIKEAKASITQKLVPPVVPRPREDFDEAKAAGQRFAVIFEQRGCPYCTKMHTEMLSQQLHQRLRAAEFPHRAARHDGARARLPISTARRCPRRRWPSAGA